MLSLLPLLPLFHVGGPEPTGPLYTHWILDPKIAVFVIVLTGAYLAWVGPLNRRRPGYENRPVTSVQIRWFLLGQLLLVIALGPPIDDWSHFFFSSVHMFQHLLLMFAVVPCWIKGTPPWVFEPLVRNKVGLALLTWIPRAVPAFLLATLIIVLWHIPEFYNATLTNEFIHAMQHMFFLVTGFLFFWPLMSTVPESPQLSPPMKCVYLFLQTIPSGVIGATIVYAAPGLYPHYGEATVRPWGISIAEDQQWGGLMMWVGMNSVFLIMLSIIFIKWAMDEERKDREALRNGMLRQRIAPVEEPAGSHTMIS
ncbi:MAG TPA: cytochrome c oxidase assembly protein [Thermomicrobiales bacterium]|nr:cytochrome c oxidase assembly protein [Thermomicrobiales bacterium]